jgi:hypothetical protein
MTADKHCYTGLDECPHKPACVWDCERLYDQTVRKIKPYPAIPPDIEPVPDTWHTVGTLMLTGIFGVLAVICLALFFTGVWIWSLLI